MVRVVRCGCCGWYSIVPASLDAEAALELGRGLAQLHLENAHRQPPNDEPQFDYENFELPTG